jgi:O-antigen/teichoic acid export membrane protein
MNTKAKLINTIRPLIQSNVLHNFIIYIFGAICLGGFSILLAPINMRILSPDEYGVIALITSCMSIGVTILGFGLRQFLSIEYFHHDTHGQKKLVNQVLIMYLYFAIPVCLILVAFRSQLTQWLSLHNISPQLFIISLITMFFSFFAELFYQVLRYQQRAWALTFIQTTIALTSLAFTIILLLYLGLGVMSTFIGQLTSMCMATCAGFYVYRQEKFANYFHLKQPKATILHFLKNGLPFIPGILFGWIISSSDRFVLAQYASMHDVGIYAIADMAGQMFRLLILQSWSGSYLPYILLEYQANKNNLLAVEEKNRKTMWIVLSSLTVTLICCFILAKPLLRIILPQAYHEALHYVLIILAGHIFLLGSYFAASFIQFHKKTYFLAAAFCVPAILNLIFNLLLVERYKIYGCTVATLCSYAIYFLIILWYNARISKPYREQRAQ